MTVDEGRRRLSGRDLEGDVIRVARRLIGCALVVDGVGGVIVETEAYHSDEEACHAYRGPTPRAARLFGPAGIAYVYLSYGIHSLFNVVTGPQGEAAAVLVRALEPIWSLELMAERRRTLTASRLCSGPGKLAQALGISTADDGASLETGRIALLTGPTEVATPTVVSGPRVGITKAVELPWRFAARGSPWVSSPQPGR